MLLERHIATVLGHRGLVVVLAALAMLAMAGGLPFVTATNDFEILFSEDNPERLAFNALEDTYSASNRALIAIAPREGSVFTREVLGAFVAFTEAAWHAPYSTRVDSLTNYIHSEAVGDDLIVASLVEDVDSLDDADLARVEAIALSAAEIAGRLVARDGRAGGVAINFVLPENPDLAIIEITDYLDALMDKAHASNPDINYYMTGDVAFNRALAEAAQHDAQILTPIVFLIIAAATMFLLRSVLGTAAIITVLVFVLCTTIGIAGWVDTVFSPGNAGIPVILMVITVAHTIHIVTDVLLGLKLGLDRNAAIVESIRTNAYPVFLTSLTTAIGFLTLNASDSPPFHVLGNFVALGVLFAYIYSMTLLPALLSFLPLRVRRAQADRRDFFERFANFVIERRKLLLWSFALVAVVLIAGIPRNELTDNWTQYFDERFDFRRDTDFISANLTGMDTLEYSLNTGRESGITNPSYLRAVDAFANWYRDQPEVIHVQAFPDIMKRLNKNMHGDDPAFYQLPANQELAAQYLLLYEFSLPFGSNLNDRIDVAKSATRMTVTTHDISTAVLHKLDNQAQDWLYANAPDLVTAASGTSMIFAHIAERNIRSMMGGTIIAMTLISLILVLVFRNLKIGFISFLPNFLPAAMTFGLWGYLVGRVGLASSVMVIIAFGIIVDDTIHFLTKYLKSRREGLLAPEAVRATFCTVGRALWTTTAVLSLGFLMYATSGYEISWSLGLMVTTTIIFAFAGDFLLLPALLILIDRKKL